jgi:hypothetical protein
VIVEAEAVVDVAAIVTAVVIEGVDRPVTTEVDAVAEIVIAPGAEAVIAAAELPPELLLGRFLANGLILRIGTEDWRIYQNSISRY